MKYRNNFNFAECSLKVALQGREKYRPRKPYVNYFPVISSVTSIQSEQSPPYNFSILPKPESLFSKSKGKL